MTRVVLLVLTGFIVHGCSKDDDDRQWQWPTVWRVTPNGHTYGLNGPWPGHAPDYFPGLDGGYTTLSELESELDKQVDAFFAAHPDVDDLWGRTIVRSLRFIAVDDYVIEVWDEMLRDQGIYWAVGITDGVSWIIAAYWARGTTQNTTGSDPSGVPSDAPPYTIRGPNETYNFWRYGTRPLWRVIPHEIGHVFYGPDFEH